MTAASRMEARLARWRQVVGLAAALLVVSACTSAGDDQHQQQRSASSASKVTLLQPGRPGEAAATVGPDAVPADPGWNHADVAFMQMMVPHHEQALEMSALARTRARSEQVKALARRITGAQGPEIIAIAAWLQKHDVEVPKAGDDPAGHDHSKHGHTPMAGMLTEEEMDELGAARGRRFDRLFLEHMIAHHQGAVEMATVEGSEGVDIQATETAAEVSAGQLAEIKRMRELLRAL